MSGDNRPAAKQARRLKKAVRSYSQRAAEHEAARRELAGRRVAAAGDPAVLESVALLESRLEAEAANLRGVREVLVNACRDLGAGFVLPEVVS